MKYFVLRHYGLIATILCLAGVTSILVAPNYCNWQLVVTIVGGGLSSLYVAQRQRLEELKLFKELFTEFNNRYDSLNEKLNHILRVDPTEPLKSEELDILNDYFNLCGEEYLYYKEGYIYKEVWRAWFNGMKIFFENPRIKSVWKKELENGSYYGLQLE